MLLDFHDSELKFIPCPSPPAGLASPWRQPDTAPLGPAGPLPPH